MNTDAHPDVFQNRGEVTAPNQDYFKRNAFDEWKRDQDQMRARLMRTVANLNKQYKALSVHQKSDVENLQEQLNALTEETSLHEQFRKETKRWLTMLEDNQAKLQQMLEHDETFKEEMKQDMMDFSTSQQALLDELLEARTELTSQTEQLMEFRNQVLESLIAQDDQQTHLLERMDNQEALLEKVTRQVHHFRSILFERSSYLAEKIDNSCQKTSDYVYEWVMGSDQSLTLLNSKRSNETGKVREK
ncbi:hypothetical protein [Lentibacillus sp. JNUCC-1]|uniref:hypothetical protein n=1 Tax=Lentibacillus sp. JNUCC-1 TaxID=2654513 RepID=UPI0012E95309|nr:hypothetical protein [Lentibacillus sp. JNUCC-1]